MNIQDIVKLLVLITIVVLATCSCNGSTKGVDIKQADTISEHFTGVPSNSTDGSTSSTFYRFSFSSHPADETVVEDSDYPVMEALVLAAATYSMHYCDFVVTLDDVITSGYWPFKVVPDCDPSEYVLSNRHCYKQFSIDTVTSIGTAEWILSRKAAILRSFYREYYYYPEFSKQGRILEFCPVLPSDLQPIPAFWISPLTGEEFEYGEEKGAISQTPLDWLTVTGECRLVGDTSHSPVVTINRMNLMPAPFRKNGKIVSEEVYPDDWCCFFVADEDREDLPQDFVFPETIQCPCTEDESVKVQCLVTWQWYGGGYYHEYEPLGAWPCSAFNNGSLPGILSIPCNTTRTLYVYGCGPAFNCDVICSECPAGPAPDPRDAGYYCSEYVELMDDVVNDERAPRKDIACICP